MRSACPARPLRIAARALHTRRTLAFRTVRMAERGIHMRVALFCHSLLSDWNNDAASFLRGVATELLARRHDVRVYEPRDAWSVENLVRDHGEKALDLARAAYPRIRPKRYDLATIDLEEALDDVDLVLVHDWNDPELVKRIGDRRKKPGARFKALFHDTHHRTAEGDVTSPACDLDGYDGVLAISAALRDHHDRQSTGGRSWVWHEAADPRVFFPVPAPPSGKEGDVVFVGGCEEEVDAAALREWFVEPVKELGQSARAYGPRYREAARNELAKASIGYAGWIPDFRVPDVFARFKATVHIESQQRPKVLQGVPSIRVFEALACAIPIACAPWQDGEGILTRGRDYLAAADGAEMRRHLKLLANDAAARSEIARHGRSTILARHTCAHRVDELISIAGDLGVRVRRPALTHEGVHA